MKAITHDRISYIKKLSAAKIFNYLKVWSSYNLSKLTRKEFFLGKPTAYSIEPTNKCNLRCVECPSGKKDNPRKSGFIEFKFYKNIIDEIKSSTTYLTLYFQGEPYLHYDFFEMVRYARQNKIYTATSTNAHFLDSDRAKKTVESGLNRLVISVDGTTQETYGKYRKRGELSRVIEGLKEMVKWKKELKSDSPYIVLQFLVFKTNEHQINEIKQLGREIGVDKVELKTAQLYNYENGHPLMTSIDKYSRYKKGKDGKYAIKSKLPNHCWRLWSTSVITWKGDIVPCCFDKDATFKMGNLNNEAVGDILKGDLYRNFRKKILSDRTNVEICKNCTEGLKA